MKKSPVFAVLALLIVIVVAFSSCEFSVDLKKDEDSDTTLAGDSATNSSILDVLGVTSAPIETDPNGVPYVTVAVTDKKGEVVATEKVTLSADEIQTGKDFFKPAQPSTTLPSGVSPERVTEATTQNNQKPSETDSTPAVRKDIDIIYSDRYVVTGRIEYDGNIEIYKVARDGNKYSAVANYQGKEIGVIAGEDSMYIIDMTEKTYYTIPKALIEQEAEKDESYNKLLTGEAFDIDKKVIEETKEEEYGVKYNVTKYEDGSADYTKGKTLIKSVSADGVVLYYDSVSDKVSPSLFLPPVGFTETVINEESISEIAGTATTHIHEHE